jgi:hypothetical protein
VISGGWAAQVTVQFLAAGAVVGGETDILALLTNASPLGLFAIFIVALLKRWLILPREIDEKDKRIAQLESERDEYKGMAFRALDIGERITSATEQRQDGR